MFFLQEQSDHDFVEFMRLEAVNPISPKYIHMATVTRVRGQHIWLGLEGEDRTAVGGRGSAGSERCKGFGGRMLIL